MNIEKMFRVAMGTTYKIVPQNKMRTHQGKQKDGQKILSFENLNFFF